ncbi:hypothetical protein [Bdellovibrio sp. HCB2-146]|uniref:hypothetical protein n=1 Tax=Bdellovibrio sp. HCB2-146 TaxID=3394362 RepID=UPI0039BD4AAA
MRKFTFLLSLMLLPLTSHAVGNRDVHCRSARAELRFHTEVYGTVAVGEYTVVDGKRADLPKERLDASGDVLFFNQGRVFMVVNAQADKPKFKLLGHLFGDETILLEEGECVAL